MKTLLFFLMAVCAYAQISGSKMAYNEPRVKKIHPHVSRVQERDLTDCTLSALFNQDLMNLCSDEIFAEANNYTAENYEPMPLPDESTDFTFLLIIEYDGELNLTNGLLYNISSLHRDGDVVISVDNFTQNVNLSVAVSFDKLDFTFDYSGAIMGLSPTGGVEGNVSNVELGFGLSYDSDANQFALDFFQIINAGDLQVHLDFSGDPLVDWLIELFSDVAGTILKAVFIDVMQDVVGGALQSAVDAINEALANGTTTTEPTQLKEHVIKTFKAHKLL